jgi:hypothetical protein
MIEYPQVDPLLTALIVTGLILGAVLLIIGFYKNHQRASRGNGLTFLSIGGTMFVLSVLAMGSASHQLTSPATVTGTVTKTEWVTAPTRDGGVQHSNALIIDDIDDKKFIVEFKDDDSVTEIVGKKVTLSCLKPQIEKDKPLCSMEDIS